MYPIWCSFSLSVEISEDDYYLKSAEFRTWLSKEVFSVFLTYWVISTLYFQRETFFSELTSEESRSLFRKFVTKWNKGLLDKVCVHDTLALLAGTLSPQCCRSTTKAFRAQLSLTILNPTTNGRLWLKTQLKLMATFKFFFHDDVFPPRNLETILYTTWLLCVCTSTQFASGVDSKELKSMRDSVSSWSAQGSEVKSTAGPSQPTRSMVGPSRGPAIGPARVSIQTRGVWVWVWNSFWIDSHNYKYAPRNNIVWSDH